MLLEVIEKKIFLIRGHRVMLDSDLAELYEVSTGNFNKAVSRNLDSFPPDFMFQLSSAEYKSLRFQFGILKKGAHSKYLPRVFMEQGVSMLSSVLKSKRARQVNIQIMRAFVKLRELLNSHKELARKLEELEKKYDAQFKSVFDAIKMLMAPPAEPDPGHRKIPGFKPEK
ncbi:MAG: DNA-binding protein [Elusimicrobia bacterium GWC2_51_8]|nr:MAG: DNA-binding protein [Elusimicrobia bacterium GWA2_51_34]OGR63190.1 MAG: DNA-binding protein [Elusimicrobia bacterium GWC2_51_8]HAF96636.1 DNA-binding protein [Elusimicrobiota bacterium]HCE97313.1 DNA-binding protein [Elusimicrobiota bacterium]